MRTFDPVGAMGVRLQSTDSFNWASADDIGFIWDIRKRFKVCVAYGSRRNHICRGKLGSAPLSPSSKWHFQVYIALYD